MPAVVPVVSMARAVPMMVPVPVPMLRRRAPMMPMPVLWGCAPPVPMPLWRGTAPVPMPMSVLGRSPAHPTVLVGGRVGDAEMPPSTADLHTVLCQRAIRRRRPDHIGGRLALRCAFSETPRLIACNHFGARCAWRMLRLGAPVALWHRPSPETVWRRRVEEHDGWTVSRARRVAPRAKSDGGPLWSYKRHLT